MRAICKTAEHTAQKNGGRLQVPLVMELDECANIVRWPELPSVYSYYGSMGIMLNSYFQSRAQAIDAFGKDGWQTLWDAAAHRVYGGGSGDDDFLRALAALIGDHDEITYGSSTSRDGQTSTSTNTRKVNTLDIAALGSLPNGEPSSSPPNAAPSWWTPSPGSATRHSKPSSTARSHPRPSLAPFH